MHSLYILYIFHLSVLLFLKKLLIKSRWNFTWTYVTLRPRDQTKQDRLSSIQSFAQVIFTFYVPLYHFLKKLMVWLRWNSTNTSVMLRREGGPGSKIRFPLFFHSQIFHLRWNRYFLQNEDIFACALDIVTYSYIFSNIYDF